MTLVIMRDMALAFILGVLAFFAGSSLMQRTNGYVSAHDPIPGGKGNWKSTLGALIAFTGAGMAIVGLGGLAQS